MTNRESILDALRRHPQGVSGEDLGLELGISRAAVSRHVSVLRAAGYEIEGEAGKGYRLTGSPDAPTPYEVGALLGPLPFTLHGGEVTGSTNDDARRLARDGAPEFTVVLASEQTAGRGRLGRVWSSPRGGVYLSVLLRPEVHPAQVATLSLVAALAVRRAVARFGVPASLKWPNDVRTEHGKLAGISLEMSADMDRVERVIVGIGINVSRSGDHVAASDEFAMPAYVSDYSQVPAARSAVAAAVLEEFYALYVRWTADGFGQFEDEFAAHNALASSDVVVSASDGRVIASGVVERVDEQGRLVVRDGTTTEVVSSGEVTLRLAP